MFHFAENTIDKFANKVWLSSPTMYPDSMRYVMEEAYETNWVSTVGANINEIEKSIGEKIGWKYASGTICQDSGASYGNEVGWRSDLWKECNRTRFLA